MKARLLLMFAAFSCFPVSYSQAQNAALPDGSILQETKPNICSRFTSNEYLGKQNIDAPSPVRTLKDEPQQVNSLTQEEIRLYQKLGLISLGDGSYGCIAEDPNDSSRKYTIFKVKKLDGTLVVSTFLDQGEFLNGQKTAATQLFLEMISFYTEIPEPYYSGIERYFQEFYLRITDGRITPSGERTYVIDEPTTTIAVYHPLRGKMLGTGLSLNIPLSADIQD